MQYCPNCGTQLPHKASFCAHCGHHLNAPSVQAPQKQNNQNKAQTKTPGTRNGTKVPAAPSTVANVPPFAKADPSRAKEAPAFSPPAKTPLPARNEIAPAFSPVEPPQAKKAAPAFSPPGKTPLPARNEVAQAKEAPAFSPPTSTEAIEAKETLMLQVPEKKPQPTKAEAIEAKETPSFSAPVKPPAPSRGQSIEEQKTVVVPALPQTPLPEQKTVVVPSLPQTPLPRNKAEIADQQTRAVPAVKKPSSPIEGQLTIPIAAMEKTIGTQSPDLHPTEVYSDGTFIIYKGQRQSGDTVTRVIAVKPAKPPTPVRKLGDLIWRLLSPIFARALDPEPEKRVGPQPHATLLGWLPVLALTSTLGLFTVATAFNAARDNTPGAELYFWLGLGLVFVPALARLILPQASRIERVGLLVTVALCLYLTKVTLSPLYFSGYDEFLHWTTVNHIMSSGHLFQKNALLPVSPYYPGLEIVTSALSNLSGLSTFQSGVIVIGMSCMVMTLSMFLLCELLSGSARLASIATIIYMTNPHFLFFDNQFGYESLAIPLATFVVFAMTRYETLNNNRRWIMLSAWIVLTAMIATHHLTNFIFEGLFMLWATIYLFLRPLPLRKSIVIWTVIIGMTLTVITVLLIGNTVIGYFTSFFGDVGGEIAQSLSSSGGDSRQLFSDAGTPTPLWERGVSLGSVGLVTLAIPFLLLCFWRRYRRNSLLWVFSFLVLLYPVLQVLRLTSSGAEASDRASAFVFIAVGFLAAVAIVQFWPIRSLNWKHSTMLSVAILVLFMGGIILGDGIPPSFMPGPYQVSADARSVEPEGIQAALWAHQYLGPNNRMYTDRINQLLMSLYGEQYLVTKIGDNIDVTDVFFSTVVSDYEISLLKEGQIHYLEVDMRLSQGLPQDGFYFEAGEPDANAEVKPLNPQYLTKFDTTPEINRLFDSGDIAIYDTGGLINAPKKP